MDMWPLESEVELTAPCFDFGFVQSICSGKIVPDITTLRFRNPDVFIAGQLHLHSEVWEKLRVSVPMTARMKSLTGLRIKSLSSSFFGRSKDILRDALMTLLFPPALNLIITNLVIIMLILLSTRCLKGCVVALYQS